MKISYTKDEIKIVQTAVLEWYKANGRHSLPWRNLEARGIDVPYGVLVSESMLQQTQVERVVPKFEAFMSRYPTLHFFAEAQTGEIIALWSGLGYNRRALMLHKAMQAIMQTSGRKVPDDESVLLSLPGIGRYTASAILAFGYNQPVAMVDTNVLRFYELILYGYQLPGKEELLKRATSFIPQDQSREWHSALMDLITKIRKIKSPQKQQLELFSLLGIAPNWEVPKLSDISFHRPKQSTFTGSKRYYRGKILSLLSQSPHHRLEIQALHKMVLYMPPKYRLDAILIELRREGLIHFDDPLTSQSSISLSV